MIPFFAKLLLILLASSTNYVDSQTSATTCYGINCETDYNISKYCVDICSRSKTPVMCYTNCITTTIYLRDKCCEKNGPDR